MTPFELHLGNSLDVLPTLPDASVDAVVCDPPYELTGKSGGKGFMGKEWDGSGIAHNVALWRECLRVLKPGGHLIAFGGSRTYHRLACAVEDAGFEIRDQVLWVYGSGFPKSLDVSKAIDKAAGAEREIVGKSKRHVSGKPDQSVRGLCGTKTFEESVGMGAYLTAPHTDAAKKWAGFGSGLKPAHEPAVLARKPLDGTVAANVLRHGTGALNIDACRIETGWERELREEGERLYTPNNKNSVYGKGMGGGEHDNALGRWPANLIHDGSPAVLALFPQTDGQAGAITGDEPSAKPRNSMSDFSGHHAAEPRGDTGSAARFFYCAKADTLERNTGCEELPDSILARSCQAQAQTDRGETVQHSSGAYNKARITRNNHPTVKPITLMAHLVRLVTPPGGVVLDPFMGSGSTGVAAIRHGFRFIGIEMTPEYHTIATHRITHALDSDLVSQALAHQ